MRRQDDLVGLRSVEPRSSCADMEPLEARIHRIDAIAHSDQLPLRQAHAPNATGPSNRTDTTALPAQGDPGVSRNLVPDLPMAGSGLTLAAPLRWVSAPDPVCPRLGLAGRRLSAMRTPARLARPVSAR